MKTIYNDQDYKIHLGNLTYRCNSGGELIDPYNPQNFNDPSFLSPAERDLYEAYCDQPTYAYVATRDGVAYMVLAMEYDGDCLYNILDGELDIGYKNIPEDWQQWMIEYFTNLEVLLGPNAECYLDFWSMCSANMTDKAEFLLLIPYKDRGKIHERAQLILEADKYFSKAFTDKFGKPQITPPEETEIDVPYSAWDSDPSFSKLVTFQSREQAEWYQKEVLNTRFDEDYVDLPDQVFDDTPFPKTVLLLGREYYCATYSINKETIHASLKFISELYKHL
ncbi:MAG: hypothetical protein J6S14_15640 [Clostridia bacterium]|nr:hypothetical protein [Clostridia bacterium]